METFLVLFIMLADRIIRFGKRYISHIVSSQFIKSKQSAKLSGIGV